MSEPLSIAAGVIGILTAAAEISKLLVRFTKAAHKAPAQAQHVVTDVNDIRILLSQLQSFLVDSEYTDRSRTSLLKVDEIVTIVSSCVLTFSELEKTLYGLKTDDMRILDSMRWARAESEIMSLIQRLHVHKASLSLILSILHGYTLVEAKESLDRLHDLIDSRYQDMLNRIQELEFREMQRMSFTAYPGDWEQSDFGTPQNPHHERRFHGIEPKTASNTRSSIFAPDFVIELKQSWVYSRNSAFRSSTFTSGQQSMAWSCLSALSVSEVSNISVFNLAITLDEITSSERLSRTWSKELARSPSPQRPFSTATSASLVGSVSPSLQEYEPAGDVLLVDADNERSDDTTMLPLTGPWPVEDLDLPVGQVAKSQSQLQSNSGDEGESDFSCIVCSNRLSEGLAYQIAGGRYHMECCKCITCGTLFGSDSKPYQYRSGFLSCAACLYRCSACGTKPEGLYISTGDQAFCADCFRCRNCKQKIETGYSRTSQGIFCMECHHFVSRRNAKKAMGGGNRDKQPSSGAMLIHKSLPSLPPDALPSPL